MYIVFANIYAAQGIAKKKIKKRAQQFQTLQRDSRERANDCQKQDTTETWLECIYIRRRPKKPTNKVLQNTEERKQKKKSHK